MYAECDNVAMSRSCPELPRFTRRRIGLSAGLLLLSVAALAAGAAGAQEGLHPECPGRVLSAVRDVAATAAPDVPDVAPVAATCKAWPYDPSVQLVAAAFPASVADLELRDERQLQVVIAMLDAGDAGVVASHTYDVGEDAMLAISEDSLKLDTARYDLAPGVRAIGLVIDSSARGASCPDGHVNRELTLLVREGAQLRPVLSTYLHQWSVVEGVSCAGREQRFVGDTAAITIGVERDTHHGFADLALMASVERDISVPDEAMVTEHYRRRRVLQYDGRSYGTNSFDHNFFWSDDTSGSAND